MKYFDEIAGNIFFIPLFLPNNIKSNMKSFSRTKFDPNKQYAFGRLIESNKSSGDLIEIFSYIGSIPNNHEVIINSKRLISPIHVTMGFEKKRWRFIFENSSYDKMKDSDYSKICFLLGDQDNRILWQGGVQKPYSGKTVGINEWIVYPPTKIENLIREKMQ